MQNIEKANITNIDMTIEDSKEQNKKELQKSKQFSKSKCIECNSQKNLVLLFGGNEYMCKQCYAFQNDAIIQYKLGKPTLYGECDFIIDGIFLGNQDAAMQEQTFQKNGISAVCACGSYLITPFQDKYPYKKYDIADFQDQKIIHFFDENHAWIKQMHKQNRKVLIHCAAGVSRSASFTIAYLMKEYKMNYHKAHNYVKQKRRIIRPNSGFIKQLQQYQKMLGLYQIVQQQQKKKKPSVQVQVQVQNKEISE